MDWCIANTEEKYSLWYSHKDLQALRTACQAQGLEDNDACDNSCSSHSSIFELHPQHHRQFVAELLRPQAEHRIMGVRDPKGLFQYS